MMRKFGSSKQNLPIHRMTMGRRFHLCFRGRQWAGGTELIVALSKRA
jgi:hypothetical protein